MEKAKWNVVHDCDLDDGTAACWSIEGHKDTYYWIGAMADGTYDVISADGSTVLKTCQSLQSAISWVIPNLL